MISLLEISRIRVGNTMVKHTSLGFTRSGRRGGCLQRVVYSHHHLGLAAAGSCNWQLDVGTLLLVFVFCDFTIVELPLLDLRLE